MNFFQFALLFCFLVVSTANSIKTHRLLNKIKFSNILKNEKNKFQINSYFRSKNSKLFMDEALTGYVYFQYYNDAECSEYETFSTGVGAGVCILDGTMSYRMDFTKEDCSDLVVTYFSDTQCQEFFDQQNLNFQKTCDIHEGVSYKTLCYIGSDIPLNYNAIIYQYYRDDTDKNCSKSNYNYEFTGIANNVCIKPSSFNEEYMISNCGTNSLDFSYYLSNSGPCDQFINNEIIPIECLYSEDDPSDDFMGLFQGYFEPFCKYTPAPTSSPTKTPESKQIKASQYLDNFSFNDYSEYEAANQEVIQQTITTAMNNISNANFISFKVSSLESNSVLLDFEVSFSSSDSVEEIMDIYKLEVNNGNFNSILHANALKNPSCSPQLQKALSFEVYYSEDDDTSNKLTDGAIAGIIIGTIAGVFITGYFVYILYFTKPKEPLSNQETH